MTEFLEDHANEIEGSREGRVTSLVMSPSRSFPAQAKPSYEGSEPSRAELGHFKIRAGTELTICQKIANFNLIFPSFYYQKFLSKNFQTSLLTLKSKILHI